MKKRRTPPWEIAARQHGAIKTSQLGLSGAAIAEWVRSGRLHRRYRGVFAFGHPDLSREGEWMAAVLAAGEAPCSPG